MRALIAAALLVFFGSSYPAPDPNVKSVQSVAKEQARDTQTKNSAPAGAGTSKSAFPSASVLADAPSMNGDSKDTQNKSHQPGQHDHWGNKSEFWLFVATVFLTLATIVLSIYTYRLWRDASEAGRQRAQEVEASIREAGRAADAMREVANATFQQGEITRKQFLLSSRPRLILRDATSEQDMGNFIKINYVLANTGSTVAQVKAAALDVRVFKGWEFGPDNLPEIAADIDDTSNEIKPFKLQPGEQASLSFTSKTLRWDDDNDTCHTFLELEYGLFFYGQVIYWDELSTARRIGFRRKFASQQNRFLRVDDAAHYEYQD